MGDMIVLPSGLRSAALSSVAGGEGAAQEREGSALGV
jgi:hypothetical protein